MINYLPRPTQEYLLTHTPRQIALECDYQVVRFMSQYYSHREGMKYPPNMDYSPYYDIIPSDEQIQHIIDQCYTEDKPTVEAYKMAFIAANASYLAQFPDADPDKA